MSKHKLAIIAFVLALAVVLSAFRSHERAREQESKKEKYRVTSPFSSPFIQRGSQFPSIKGMEATPVVFNKELLYISTQPEPTGIHVVVVRQSDTAILSDQLIDMEFISAIVNNGILYVFGTTDSRTAISMTSTSDLKNWSGKSKIYKAPTGRNVFNTSVTPSPNGFTMAYEVCDQERVCFNVNFLQSKDLAQWVSAGKSYEDGYYTACPTIRFVNGYYYLFFLSAHPSIYRSQIGLYYSTNVSRSTNLINWNLSYNTVLSPLDGDPAMNSSDFELVEFNGQVRIVYSDYPQVEPLVPDTGLREAIFNGPIQKFVQSFF